MVPLAYFAVVLELPAGARLGEPEAAPWIGRLLYDDYDSTAMALRGLNANDGRTAGRADMPPSLGEKEFERALDSRQQLEPSYFLEYPQTALLIFRLGWALPQAEESAPPPAVCDASHLDVVGHTPRNESERTLWRQFRQTIRTYDAIMILCLIGFMTVLRAGYQPGGRMGGPLLLVLLPGALYFALNRFDIVPALLVALGLACLGRRWLLASAVFLGTATMVKVYPVLLVPLVLRYLSTPARSALYWLAAYTLTAVAWLLPPLLLSGWTATWAPYYFQFTRPPEFGWTLYGYALPESLAQGGLLGRDFPARQCLVGCGPPQLEPAT